MNRKVVIKKDDKLLGNESGFENISLNGKVNFLIGKNNSGKSRFAKHLEQGNLTIEEDGLEKEIDILYMGNDNDSIEYEIKSKSSSVTKKKTLLKEMTSRGSESLKDDKTIKLKPTGSDLINEFNLNKEIIITEKVTLNAEVKIDGVPSKDSGSGESRMFYLSYIRDLVYEVYFNEERIAKYFDNIFKQKLDSDELKDYFDELENKRNVKEKLNEKFESLSNDMNIDCLMKWIFYNAILKGPLYSKNELDDWDKLSKLISKEPMEDMRKRKKSYGGNDFQKIMSILNTNGNMSKLVRQVIDSGIKVEMVDIDYEELLIIVDEPEKFLHYNYFNLFKEIVDDILKIEGLDIKFLFITHSERLLRYFREYIENTNVAFKDGEGNIFYKNIFNNSMEEFIKGVKNDYEEIIREIKNSGEDSKSTILDPKLNIDKNFISWFLTSKDNVKLFFSSKLQIVEGWHEWMYFISQFDQKLESEIITLDGLHNLPIILNLLDINQELDIDINVLFDLDTKTKFNKKGSNKNKVYDHINITNKSIITHCQSKFKNVKYNCLLFGDINNFINFVIENLYNPIIKNERFKNEFSDLVDLFGYAQTRFVWYHRNKIIDWLKDGKYDEGYYIKNIFIKDLVWNWNSKSNDNGGRKMGYKELSGMFDTTHRYLKIENRDIAVNSIVEIIKYFESRFEEIDISSFDTELISKFNKNEFESRLFNLDNETSKWTNIRLREVFSAYINSIYSFEFYPSKELFLKKIRASKSGSYRRSGEEKLLQLKILINKLENNEEKANELNYINEKKWNSDWDINDEVEVSDIWNIKFISQPKYHSKYGEDVDYINVDSKKFININSVFKMNNWFYSEDVLGRGDYDLSDILNSVGNEFEEDFVYINLELKDSNEYNEIAFGPLVSKQDMIDIAKDIIDILNDQLGTK